MAGAPMAIVLRVNGVEQTSVVAPRLLLSDYLRHDLRLTGTHVGCEHGVCGACTVLVDGVAVRSCLMFAVQADGSDVRTVEGLTRADDSLTPIPAAFRDEHGLQCGFCTPGIMMSLAALAEAGVAGHDEIVDTLGGHLCRCTGYRNVVRAAERALSVAGTGQADRPAGHDSASEASGHA